MSWSEEQAEEIEGLSMMYDDDWKCVSTNPARFTLNLRVGYPRMRVLVLEITFNEGYPTNASVDVEFKSDWICKEDRRELESVVAESKARSEGTYQIHGLVLDITDYFKNRDLDDMPNETTSASNQTPDRSPKEHAKSSPTKHEKVQDEERPPQKFSSVEIYHGEPFVDRRSTFQAHLMRVKSRQEVMDGLKELKSNSKIAKATHNCWAYRIKTELGHLEDCDNDGETPAGARMLHLMTILDVSDVLVVVSRWYGGIQLGPDRFRHFNNCCRNILEEHGLIKPKPSKNQKETRPKKK